MKHTQHHFRPGVHDAPKIQNTSDGAGTQELSVCHQGSESLGTSREQPYGGKVDIAMVLQGSVKEAASARYEREQPVLLFIETCSTAVEQVTGYAGRVCCGCGDGSWARQCTRGLSGSCWC